MRVENNIAVQLRELWRWKKKALLTAKKKLAGSSYLSRQNSFVGYSLSQCRESERRKDVSLRSAVRSFEATP